jgi:hypothetical protein
MMLQHIPGWSNAGCIIQEVVWNVKGKYKCLIYFSHLSHEANMFPKLKACYRLLFSSPAPLASDTAALNRACERFEVDNWRLSEFVVQKLIPLIGVRPFPINEQLLMAGAVCWFQPAHVIEWGTHVGKSARLFYETSRFFQLDAQVHSIDLPDDVAHVEHPGQARGQLVRGLSGVTLYQGDGLAVGLELGGKLDGRLLYFLDGDHAYASVRRELEEIMDTFPQAAILAHDTFYQSAEAGYNVGPHQALDEALSARPGCYQRLAAETGLPGLTLLLPIKKN